MLQAVLTCPLNLVHRLQAALPQGCRAAVQGGGSHQGGSTRQSRPQRNSTTRTEVYYFKLRATASLLFNTPCTGTVLQF
jgi:hypothetical protein